MMPPQRVWKHELSLDKSERHGDTLIFEVEAPIRCSFISVGVQENSEHEKNIVIWELHDVADESKIYEHSIMLVGTGLVIPSEIVITHFRSGHIGTVQLAEVVWHVFEVAVNTDEWTDLV